MIGAVIGAGGWITADLLPDEPTAPDEQAVASTGCRDTCAAAGVGAEATSLCEMRHEDKRGGEAKGVHLYSYVCVAMDCGSGSQGRSQILKRHSRGYM